MIKEAAALILLLFLISGISALCNETQIDINSASKEKLMDITQIGNSTADKIIIYRQNNLFNSVDELTNISGIKEAKLEKIKAQGLACVSLAVNETNETSEQEIAEPEISPENLTNSTNDSVLQASNKNTTIIKKNNNSKSETVAQIPPNYISAEIKDTIVLNSSDSKDIKTGKDVWSSDKIAVYGFIAFSILIAILFIFRMKKSPKTEFKG